MPPQLRVRPTKKGYVFGSLCRCEGHEPPPSLNLCPLFDDKIRVNKRARRLNTIPPQLTHEVAETPGGYGPVGRSKEQLRDLAKQVLKSVRSAQMHSIPMLPGVATRALELSRRLEVTIPELEKIIQPDPMITARVLAIANSPLYGSSSPVRSLRAAIMRLGVNLMRDVLYQTVAEAHIFKGGNEARLRRQRIHSIAVAYLARDVAQCLPDKMPSPFLCGLMHDLGETILYQILENPMEWGIREKDIPGVVTLIHPHIGEAIAERWRLPEEVREAIRRHHVYSGFAKNGGYSRIGNVIAVADTLATAVGLGEGNGESEEFLSLAEVDLDYRFSDLGLNSQQASDLFERAVALATEIGS